MTEFKVVPVKGRMPIIIDHCNYKITFFMGRGIAIKFFKLHGDRWYKIKETRYEYFQIDEAIAWAKSAIDNDTTGYFEDLLRKQVALKNPSAPSSPTLNKLNKD